jgi:hypothetical protein
MRKTYVILFLVLYGFCLFAVRITKSEILGAYDKEGGLKKTIIIGDNIKLIANIQMTPRGNGGLRIANLDLHVYDSYHDVAYYENDLLDIDFIDINKDGYKDIIVSGIVCYEHDKKNIILCREPVVFIYMFSPKKKKFFLSYRNASFKLEDGATGARLIDGYPKLIDKAIKEGRKEAQEDNEAQSTITVK